MADPPVRLRHLAARRLQASAGVFDGRRHARLPGGLGPDGFDASKEVMAHGWGFPSMGGPNSWMVFVRENPTNMDDDWGPVHQKTPKRHPPGAIDI